MFKVYIEEGQKKIWSIKEIEVESEEKEKEKSSRVD